MIYPAAPVPPDILPPTDTSDLLAAAGEGFAPDPDLTCDEWAIQRRVLTSDDSKVVGPWRHDPIPWARDIMRALSPQVRIRTVVWRSSSQTAKTAILLNFIGCAIDVSPGPALVVQPTQNTAKKFSRQRLRPMINACETLREKVTDGGGREGGNSTFEKEFPGGTLFLGWAGSADELASMPIRFLACDEVSKWKRDLDKQGDALGQARQRTQNYGDDAKEFIPSTPTLEGECTVTDEYEAGDQRILEVPCPDCGAYQELKWEQVQWEKDVRDGKTIHRPETAAYVCEACGTLWSDVQRLATVKDYRWVALNWNGERRVLTAADWTHAPNGICSCSTWCIYTPWITHEELAREFLKARHDPSKLQRFTNLKLGRPWRPDRTELDAGSLARRRVTPGAGELPAYVAVLTASVDVQGDRLEVLVTGWGEGERCFVALHQRLMGDPERDDVWARLEAVLTRGFTHEAGATLYVRACCIDARFKSESVYRYVRHRAGRGVFATFGEDRRAKELLSRPKKPNRFGVRPVTLATYNLKDSILPRLTKVQPGAGYIEFAAADSRSDGLDANFFEQFKAEVKTKTKDSKGRLRWAWKQVAERNEAVDLLCYAYAALLLLGPAVYDRLDYWHESVVREGARAEAQRGESCGGDVQPAGIQAAPVRRTRQSRFVSGLLGR